MQVKLVILIDISLIWNRSRVLGMQMVFNITILISRTLCAWNYSVVIRNRLCVLYWGNKNTNVVGIIVFPIAESLSGGWK